MSSVDGYMGQQMKLPKNIISLFIFTYIVYYTQYLEIISFLVNICHADQSNMLI